MLQLLYSSRSPRSAADDGVLVPSRDMLKQLCMKADKGDTQACQVGVNVLLLSSEMGVTLIRSGCYSHQPQQLQLGTVHVKMAYTHWDTISYLWM